MFSLWTSSSICIFPMISLIIYCFVLFSWCCIRIIHCRTFFAWFLRISTDFDWFRLIFDWFEWFLYVFVFVSYDFVQDGFMYDCFWFMLNCCSLRVIKLISFSRGGSAWWFAFSIPTLPLCSSRLYLLSLSLGMPICAVEKTSVRSPRGQSWPLSSSGRWGASVDVNWLLAASLKAASNIWGGERSVHSWRTFQSM